MITINPDVVGAGMIEMDIALFMCTVASVGVQLSCLRSQYVFGWSGFARLLHLVGWLIMGARFGSGLFTQGDIYISAASAIGLMFLACGEIVVGINRKGKP